MEKIVITSALPYANGEIHLGHITSTYLPADILARYLRLKKANVVFTCATDDFGTPILIEAEKERKSPKDFVRKWHEVDEKDFKDLGISFDVFGQTSSDENVELAQHFFRKLNERGYIFKESIFQPYCESDKKFLPDRYIKGTCPYCSAANQYSDGCEKCGRILQPGDIIDPRCAICGSTPVNKQSDHYFFSLSSFSESLKEWLSENEGLQPEVKNYVLKWIEEGLKDWDVTRDMNWGVPVPMEEAEGKVLYGWFDNHLGYISTTLKHLADNGIYGKDFWNSSTIYHFIGKDIVYHHFLFLPAMRLGVEEFKLPEYIPTRGHLMLQGQKFSKSRGWYISVRDFLNKFPTDYLRYYLAIITPYDQTDVNFDWEDFRSRINNELIAKIGNFVHRTLSFTWSNRNGKVPKPNEYDEFDKEFQARIKATSKEVGREIEKNELSRGIRKILEFASFCNQYFQRKAPWANKKEAGTCLFLCVNATRTLSILLEPYLPFSSERLWQQLNLEGSVHKQKWDSASLLTVRSGHQINQPKVLFKIVQKEETTKEKERLKVSS